jgi:hypothetical protein
VPADLVAVVAGRQPGLGKYIRTVPRRTPTSSDCANHAWTGHSAAEMVINARVDALSCLVYGCCPRYGLPMIVCLSRVRIWRQGMPG